jgi:hypothetical protein
MIGVRISAGAGNFFSDTASRPGSGAHPASYLVGTKDSFPGGKAAHSPTSRVQVKECMELYLHSPIMSSWRGAYLSTGTTLPFISQGASLIHREKLKGDTEEYNVVRMVGHGTRSRDLRMNALRYRTS